MSVAELQELEEVKGLDPAVRTQELHLEVRRLRPLRSGGLSRRRRDAVGEVAVTLLGEFAERLRSLDQVRGSLEPTSRAQRALDRHHDRLLLLAEEPDFDVLVLVEPATELAEVPLLNGDLGLTGVLVLDQPGLES